MPLSKAERYERDFGDHAEWVRAQSCLIPGCGAPRCHPHHAKTRGAGGTKRHLVPLCCEHHAEVHRVGRKTFERVHDLDLFAAAEQCWQLSPHGPNAWQFEDEVVGVPV